MIIFGENFHTFSLVLSNHKRKQKLEKLISAIKKIETQNQQLPLLKTHFLKLKFGLMPSTLLLTF